MGIGGWGLGQIQSPVQNPKNLKRNLKFININIINNYYLYNNNWLRNNLHSI